MRPGVSFGVLGCPVVSRGVLGNQTDPYMVTSKMVT